MHFLPNLPAQSVSHGQPTVAPDLNDSVRQPHGHLIIPFYGIMNLIPSPLRIPPSGAGFSSLLRNDPTLNRVLLWDIPKVIPVAAVNFEERVIKGKSTITLVFALKVYQAIIIFTFIYTFYLV